MSEPQSKAERQQQVEALAEEYLERLLAGETPDRQAFLAAHPDCADLLGPRLELMELMHRMARAQRPNDGATASLSPQAERVVRVKCPHCGNGIQLVEPADGEVTCGSCGSSFHVDPRATTTYNRSDMPKSIGKFEVLEQLGRGAFGTVYKARDPQLQRLVAIKVPRAGSFATPEEEERFLREARAAAQLSHPGIVPVLEIAHDRNVPYIVSEYVEGLTLADVLTGRRPGFRESAELIAAVADALDYAHRRHIVHRDVKPSNLLIDAAGRPHVTDFGLARRGEGEITVTLDGQILGTPAYMSPEQAAGDQTRVDARSDVYSLGVVLYELLTGELPFRGNQRMLLHQVVHDEPRPPRGLNDRVPRDLETICLKAMAKSPSRRYASALELADDLRCFLNNEPIRARPVGRIEKLTRWARRNPMVATLTVAVLLLLIAVAVSEFLYVITERRLNSALSDALKETELRAASAAVDLDLKVCDAGEIEYGVLRLARTLRNLPPHAKDLRQCVEMNLLAWAQELRELGPNFMYDGIENRWELSPDGLTVLTSGHDGTARLWDSLTGEVRATLRGHRGSRFHNGGIASISFSADGRLAMTVGDDKDKTLRLWDASTGEARLVTNAQPNRIHQAILSPTGMRLLTIYDGGKSSHNIDDVDSKSVVILWNIETGKQISTLAGHTGRVNDAAFSADGRTVLTGGADKTARFWSADSGRALGVLQGHTGPIVRVAFGPDGHLAATMDDSSSDQGAILRWWETDRLLQVGSTPGREVHNLRFIHRDLVVGDWSDTNGQHGELFALGMEESIEIGSSRTCVASEDRLFDSRGNPHDRRTGKRLFAPAERKFSPDLAPFAIDGRFIILNDGLTDLLTEKVIGKPHEKNQDIPTYIRDRNIFLSLPVSVVMGPNYFSRYFPIPVYPLDAELAQLFAEVVTCHELDLDGTIQPLDEATWDKRRQELARLVDASTMVFPIAKVASDPWHWLHRQADKHGRIEDLDRLIAVEPTWQNYERRAGVRSSEQQLVEAAWDFLEAGRRAGGGYWFRSFDNLTLELIKPATSTPEQYHLGLQLAEALHRAIPKDRHRRILLGIALYRVGRYAEALSLLETWHRERERDIISQVGQFFMRPWPAPHFEKKPRPQDAVEAMAFLAMTHQRLGNRERARAILADLRAVAGGDKNTQDSRREAETLIEGRPQPDK